MQEKYYIFVPSLEALLSDECSVIANSLWSQDLEVCLAMELNKDFDEWEIEKYVQRFSELCVERLRITVNKNRTEQPTYKQIMEVQGALEHFATFDAYDENEGCQKFHTDCMEIFFYSKPI